MPRHIKFAILILLAGFAAGGIYFRGLHRELLRMARGQQTEEQSRRAVLQPAIATPSDVRTRARIFWASETRSGTLEPVVVEMQLSADPAQRARQVLSALVTGPPNPEQRTLPADATLLEFYLLDDGTAVADFSDALSSQTPAGIGSEQLAIESIARTLEANVDSVKRLKILIHGVETDTLAGHVDLSGFIPLHPPTLVAPGQ